MSVLRFGLLIALLASGAACAQPTATAANSAAAHHAAAPSASAAASPAATPTPTPVQAAAPVQATQPPAPAPPPPPAASTFALVGAGSGSVRVTSANGITTIRVSAAGIAAGAHATHVHRGCDGSTMAHLFALNSVVGPAGSATTTIQMARPAPGWTLIIYPGAAAVGRPVLCAAIS
jgi:2-oxoglutarate dehydrogenase E2 component (dihydrolipoamide succinyltransferase)